MTMDSPPQAYTAGSSKTKVSSFLRSGWPLRAAQRVLADEGLGLVQLHGEHQAGFQRRFVGPQFGAPGAAAGFDAQRVQRVVAGVAQAQVGARSCKAR
jgi:hypothetical protein